MNPNRSRLAPHPVPVKLSGEGSEETRTRDSDCGKGVVIMSTRGAASPLLGTSVDGALAAANRSPESLACQAASLFESKAWNLGPTRRWQPEPELAAPPGG